ncbi:hypothetical protein IJ103_03740 [Candidatus Saccharibacteria bacterium]|nr:hypothetical protein [Candidatus Saccharibacteria bacterium]
MNNKSIYKKTISFSFWRVLWDLLALVAFGLFAGAGFVIADQSSNAGIVGLAIGAILGGIAAGVILHFFAYTYKAGQIAMMTKGITEGKLPENVVKEGKAIVKKRFATVAAYYAITGAIKGVFQQIGKGITAVGKAVGGDNGGAVGSTVASVIDTIIAYLCDCCLGWVFYKKDKGAVNATLEGAVIFFKHGKTLIRNLGRIFGISLISFLVIGGIFMGITYLIVQAFPEGMSAFSASIAENIAQKGNEVPEFIYNITLFNVVFSAIIGVIMWAILHSTFVRPFILVGVLRNFIESGDETKMSETDLDEIEQKSKKLAELRAQAK